ncbi:hypothetical protein RI030_07215 [Aphanizomenon flos-aquae NRERC-008]|uniref:Uncharacterized protein n=1 Tax=Aphanizomenon flos-aquae FACHB-1249 TaxID=2692889 RepID=A0ABR8IUY0_APHFL|nr:MULTISPECIES: hypothetical protein [Aphanizomenon]MCE2903609.1 hypothetical protein [Anabaena sp. CoA2_C59]MDJ0505474.1 hypothetical protein [Nostocales cyanobacterium LE14-WE12]MBD2391902.1 hypothetical protein [Aphanizomenon flos-aquae FACHB-1171]MBD2558146.1 hypothetical protein [Aphanizomenon flos-aquae FACHB-1290]MBD2633453.1 hypothetical protein [Aphanizomenon sp. FACHB-1399]
MHNFFGQLSVVSCQLSVVGGQLSVVGGQLLVVGGKNDFPLLPYCH